MRNSHDEEFGEARLISCVTSRRSEPVRAVLEGIFNAVREFCGETPQSDDITAMVTRYR